MTLNDFLRSLTPALLLAAVTTWHPAQAQPLPSLAPMIEQISPAVVNIAVSGSVDVENPFGNNPFFRDFLDPIPNERPFQSAGSGVIVDAAEGLILTNHHVIDNADEITVTLFDKRTASAEVIGSDQPSDLAVLRVNMANLSQIEMGNSDSLRVGDYVVAIGNPFGFSHTVTSGIVSGLGRSGVNPDNLAYEDFIQTDASINPGNSGGALVTLAGELIGINSAIISRGGGNIGIGFAIPVAMATNVMEQIIDFGVVRRGLLGVRISAVTPEIVALYDLDTTAGAYITEVTPGSAAEAAGLSTEDVIITVNGRPVGDPSALRNSIGLYRPGDAVEIGFIRNGQRLTLEARLGAQDETVVATTAPPPQEEDDSPVFEGVELAPDPASMGLRVVRIATDSIYAQAGLRQGDIIVQLNRQPVRSVAAAREIVRDSSGVVAQIRRGNRDSVVLLP